MVFGLFKKRIPEDSGALIQMAAEQLPWIQSSAGIVYVDLTRVSESPKGLLQIAVDKKLLEFTSPKGTGRGQYLMSTDNDLTEAVFRAHPDIKRPLKTPEPDTTGPTGAEMSRKGDTKPGREHHA